LISGPPEGIGGTDSMRTKTAKKRGIICSRASKKHKLARLERIQQKKGADRRAAKIRCRRESEEKPKGDIANQYTLHCLK